MNILISTTQQWNPGDEFIRYGVIKIIEEALGTGHNYLLWNRNPDLFIDSWANTNLRSNIISNCIKEVPIDIIDLVVFAGSPEWLGNPVKPIFDALYNYKHEIPVWAIGVGLSSSLTSLREEEKTILRRTSTKIITRSYELRDELNNILQMNKAITLPCPALFSSDIQETNKTKDVAFILQSDEVINQNISSSVMNQFLGYKDIDVITFYQNEFTKFTRMGFKTIYQFDSKSYFSILSQYKKIISTRLHGAIGALSSLTPAILVCDDNYRIKTAAKPYGNMLPIMSVTEALNYKPNNDIKQYKQQVLNLYNKTLENTYPL